MDIDMAMSASFRRLVRQNAVARLVADKPRRGSRRPAGILSAADETNAATSPDPAISAARRKALDILMSARSHLRRAFAISDAIR